MIRRKKILVYAKGYVSRKSVYSVKNAKWCIHLNIVLKRHHKHELKVASKQLFKKYMERWKMQFYIVRLLKSRNLLYIRVQY